MIRVVFDTNVLYSAILKPASVPARAFDLVADGLIIPCVSDDVLAEYRSVLYRSELDLHEGRRRALMDHLSALSLHVAPTDKLAIAVHEPDNRFYECAQAAQADCLVTGNWKHFPRDLPPTKIVNSRELLRIADRM